MAGVVENSSARWIGHQWLEQRLTSLISADMCRWWAYESRTKPPRHNPHGQNHLHPRTKLSVPRAYLYSAWLAFSAATVVS